MKTYHKNTQDAKDTHLGGRPHEQAFRELAQKFSKTHLPEINAFLLAMRFSAEINLRHESFYGRFNLSPGRFQILLLLRAAPNLALAPSELAAKTGVSRATMTQFIDSLEKAGHVGRKAFPGDRRAILIHLSKEGLALLDKKILPKFFKRCACMNGSISKSEMKHFLNVYEKLAKSLADFEIE